MTFPRQIDIAGGAALRQNLRTPRWTGISVRPALRPVMLSERVSRIPRAAKLTRYHGAHEVIEVMVFLNVVGREAPFVSVPLVALCRGCADRSVGWIRLDFEETSREPRLPNDAGRVPALSSE